MSARLDPANPKHARALARLASERIGWLTSIDPEGTPQASPIWFLWDGETVFIYSHRRAVRNDNIADRPRVAFNLNTDAGGDEVVTMEGVAAIDPEAPSAADNPPYLDKYLPTIKAYGWTVDFFASDYPVPIRVTPVRWRIA
jgi:PPOX class probable F420-dependent enzyme